MTDLFNRYAEVTIAPQSALGGSGPLVARTFSGLRVAFEIGKSSESTPNPGKISIYNLSATSRAVLESPKLNVILRVGYGGVHGADPVLSQIFTGDVRRVHTKREGPDLVTTIEAGDGEVAIATTNVQESFSGPTTPLQVIGALVGKFGVTVGQVPTALSGLFQNGVVLSGSAAKHLDNICLQHDLEWHITDGELNILDVSAPSLEPVVEVSARTGLIGYPSKTREAGGGAGDDIQFTALIIPELKPGRAVLLKSDVFNGTFKITKVHFRGDTHGQDWLSLVEAT